MFTRGDADATCDVGLNDAVFLLNFLFRGDSGPTCGDAADADDNGSLNLNDPLFILNYLFGAAADPGAPGPEFPGLDPTGDELDCEQSGCN